MKVKDLIESLKEYNPDADMEIVIGSQPKDFEISYGSSEGCTKGTADVVRLFPSGSNKDVNILKAKRKENILGLNQTADLEKYVNILLSSIEYKESVTISEEIGVHIFWILSGAMTEPECKGKTCKWICVTSEAYKLMKKYLPPVNSDFKELSLEQQEKGLMASLMGATITIDENCHVPKGKA